MDRSAMVSDPMLDGPISIPTDTTLASPLLRPQAPPDPAPVVLKGVEGTEVVVNTELEWLVDWLKEINERAPERLGPEVAPSISSVDQPQVSPAEAPEWEVSRLQRMRSITERHTQGIVTTLDEDLTKGLVNSALQRIREEEEGIYRAKNAPEEPVWRFLMDNWDKQVEAAKKIQAAFRAFRIRRQNRISKLAAGRTELPAAPLPRRTRAAKPGPERVGFGSGATAHARRLVNPVNPTPAANQAAADRRKSMGGAVLSQPVPSPLARGRFSDQGQAVRTRLQGSAEVSSSSSNRASGAAPASTRGRQASGALAAPAPASVGASKPNSWPMSNDPKPEPGRMEGEIEKQGAEAEAEQQRVLGERLLVEQKRQQEMEHERQQAELAQQQQQLLELRRLHQAERQRLDEQRLMQEQQALAEQRRLAEQQRLLEQERRNQQDLQRQQQAGGRGGHAADLPRPLPEASNRPEPRTTPGHSLHTQPGQGMLAGGSSAQPPAAAVPVRAPPLAAVGLLKMTESPFDSGTASPMASTLLSAAQPLCGRQLASSLMELSCGGPGNTVRSRLQQASLPGNDAGAAGPAAKEPQQRSSKCLGAEELPPPPSSTTSPLPAGPGSVPGPHEGPGRCGGSKVLEGDNQDGDRTSQAARSLQQPLSGWSGAPGKVPLWGSAPGLLSAPALATQLRPLRTSQPGMVMSSSGACAPGHAQAGIIAAMQRGGSLDGRAGQQAGAGAGQQDPLLLVRQHMQQDVQAVQRDVWGRALGRARARASSPGTGSSRAARHAGIGHLVAGSKACMAQKSIGDGAQLHEHLGEVSWVYGPRRAAYLASAAGLLPSGAVLPAPSPVGLPGAQAMQAAVAKRVAMGAAQQDGASNASPSCLFLPSIRSSAPALRNPSAPVRRPLAGGFKIQEHQSRC